MFLSFKRVQETSGFSAKELRTSNYLALTIGAIANVNMNDQNAFNGRIACVRIYNTAFTDNDVKRFSEDWECPHEPGKIAVVLSPSRREAPCEGASSARRL